MKEYYLIATIKGISDNTGSVTLLSHSDFPGRFRSLARVYVDFFGEKRELLIDHVDLINNHVVVKFHNFDSDQDAKILIGKNLFVDSKNLIRLEEDNYFIHDLIGSDVYRGSKLFGQLLDVLVYPANDVYLVRTTENREILIPAVKDYVLNFDKNKRRLNLNPEGNLSDEDEN